MKTQHNDTVYNNEPNKPDWPTNVMIFYPDDNPMEIKKTIKPTEDIKKKYKRIDDTGEQEYETYTSANHYSTKHYALLFAPGEYKECKFEIGYYVQMAGLGKSPDDVKFVGKESGPFVEALNKDLKHTEGGTIAYDHSGLCLDTFWRSAENFTADKCQWAVSQAAPLRNIIVKEELMFGDGGAYSSGGFLANARVEQKMNHGANQQWFSRAVHFDMEEPTGGAWNTCFSGCTGKVPKPGQHSYWDGKLTDHVGTVEAIPKVRVEKPFISMKVLEGEELYELVVPCATKDHVTGPHISGQYGDVRPFSQVKVCRPILPMKDGNYVEHDDDTYNVLTAEDEKITNELQAALDQKKDLVLCPGIFFLTKSLIVRHKNQVILGLGLATLVAPQNGSPCIRVEKHISGVRIAGLTLEASLQKEKGFFDKAFKGRADNVRSLFEVGEPNVEDDAGDPHNPTLLADIFCRVGGSNLIRQKVETDVMIRIHSGNVVGDNLWLWRADHVRLDKKIGEKPNDSNFPYYHQTRLWDKKTGMKLNECYVKNALLVNGDDVNMYGLFCEHTTEHQLIWKGERGSVSFYQCELPYDVNPDFAKDGYVGYHVDQKVNVHTGRAIGVYSNFQCYDVCARTGMNVPNVQGKSQVLIENPFTVYLSNMGGIKSVIETGGNSHGGEVGDNIKKISRAWIGIK